MSDFSNSSTAIYTKYNYCNIAELIPKMTVSQFEAEQVRENVQTAIFEESSKKATSPLVGQSRRNPPARNTSRFWFERFLAVIQRQNPPVVDSSFLAQIAPSNEGKLLAQLKFLGVIDDQGKPTRILPMLNMVGEEQKKAFQEIASEAYKDLESEIKMDRAVPDDIVNFFIRKYAFTRDKAVNASKFYLYLLEKSEKQVSAELSAFLAEKLANAAQSTASSTVTLQKGRMQVGSQSKESRTRQFSAGRRIQHGKSESPDVDERTPIQAVISIKLEKDTPPEYWDRVLALLGERRQSENTQESSPEQAVEGSIDSDLSGDSAYT
jgi:hypothetical protein